MKLWQFYRDRWVSDKLTLTIKKFIHGWAEANQNFKIATWSWFFNSRLLISTWQIDISFSCICPTIDHEFRHNIVKVACGSTRLYIASRIHSYSDNVMTKFLINNRTDAWKIDVILFFYNNKLPPPPPPPFTFPVNHKFMCLSTFWPWKLANKCTRISAVTVKNRMEWLEPWWTPDQRKSQGKEMSLLTLVPLLQHRCWCNVL